MEKLSFHWADYLVFALSLIVSLAIGIFFGYRDRKDATTENFLMGNRRLSIVPVGMSLVATLANAIFIIGIPAEMFYYGPVFALMVFGIVPVCFILYGIYVPTLHRLKLTSAYEYFDRRYGFPPLKIAMSLTFTVNVILFLAVVLYAPALALSEVTGLSMVVSILSCGVVGTMYTAIGGMKAVVWTDTLQVAIMLAWQLLLVFMGMYHESVGGPTEVFQRAREGNRLEFGVWDTDLRVRNTVWTMLIGHTVSYVCVFGTNQMILQRVLAVKTVQSARHAVIVSTGVALLFLLLEPFVAWVMYAYYFDCHPLRAGTISRADQLVPRFVMEIFGQLHGLPGLFTAAVFAAALSSVSSALNSLSAVILQDFIKPLYKRVTNKEVTVVMAVKISQTLATLLGILTVAMSFGADKVSTSNLYEIVSTVWGTISSPLMGVFLLSFFAPWSNGPGCLAGMLVGLVTTLWMAIGGALYGKPQAPLSPMGMCLDVNDTRFLETTNSRHGLQYFYDISYHWYGVVGLVACLAVGSTASLLFLGWKRLRGENFAQVDLNLMYRGSRVCCLHSNTTVQTSDRFHQNEEQKEADNPLLKRKR